MRDANSSPDATGFASEWKTRSTHTMRANPTIASQGPWRMTHAGGPQQASDECGVGDIDPWRRRILADAAEDVLGADLGPVGDSHRQLQHLAELGDVAPLVAKRQQRVTCVLGDDRRIGSLSPQKVLGQRDDVLRSLDQGRDFDHLIKAGEKIRRQGALCLGLGLGGPCRDDDPGVGIGALGAVAAA
jgi:hypothetical protein